MQLPIAIVKGLDAMPRRRISASTVSLVSKMCQMLGSRRRVYSLRSLSLSLLQLPRLSSSQHGTILCQGHVRTPVFISRQLFYSKVVTDRAKKFSNIADLLYTQSCVNFTYSRFSGFSSPSTSAGSLCQCIICRPVRIEQA